ncbi:Flavonoid glucosyltransferase, family GT1 [Zostera marina]|uniref:Glycosyltransferase n=1 Tax=Zostera marina TaxID=29655 RepID=A0A0K9P2Y9_ZOSMR|nr:Flavonoid glucosyltransferase, family GT1 [Zostera marina]
MDKAEGRHLVFISIPIVGHLIPMVAFAKLLTPRFQITILTMNPPLPNWAAPSAAYLASLRSENNNNTDHDLSRIRFLQLPSVDFQVDHTNHAFTTMSRFIDAHKFNVKEAISDLQQTPNVHVYAVVTDFVTSMIDVANELRIPAYVYFPSSAACLSIMLYPPSQSQLTDDMVDVVGISPVPADAMPGLITDPDGYDTFTYHGRRFNKAQGIIVNTFKELEPAVADALSAKSVLGDATSDDGHYVDVLPPVYTVGPVISIPTETSQHECIRWLDDQPPLSVVYLCFGSMGWFETKQVRQLAHGLERSQHRFLWVLRCPSNEDGSRGDTDLERIGLPDEFLKRTRSRGLVWGSWVPQMDILLHSSVGGFVTHCGWNSCLEAVWAGVPMLAWPLYAEQKFNKCEMVEDMGVALPIISKDGEGVMDAEEVEKGVRCLMGESEEGIKVRIRVTKMKDESRKAVQTRSGSSYHALELWIQNILSF